MMTLEELQELKKNNRSDITQKELAREAKISVETLRKNVKSLLTIIE